VVEEFPSELQRLVDAEDLDGVLAVTTADEIARTWHRYGAARERTVDHPDWWAVELLLTREVFKRKALYRELLLKLVAEATDDAGLGAVGAGPLENLVSDNPDDLAWLEAECATNARLRQALANVWCAGEVSDSTLARLDTAAGVRLPRPRPRG